MQPAIAARKAGGAEDLAVDVGCADRGVSGRPRASAVLQRRTSCAWRRGLRQEAALRTGGHRGQLSVQEISQLILCAIVKTSMNLVDQSLLLGDEMRKGKKWP